MNVDVFQEILRLSRLPEYMRVLEIAWWCRDGHGVTCSWLICNVRTKWAGNDAASQLSMSNCLRSSHALILVAMTTQ